MSDFNINIILPEGSVLPSDYQYLGDPNTVEGGLRLLTKILLEKHCVVPSGGFGGDFGYGFKHDSDVFMMHPFCWCEQETCPWCAGCECETILLLDGVESTYEQWSALYDSIVPRDVDDDVLDAACKEAWSHRQDKVVKQCDFCKSGVGEQYGAQPGQSAPNFWHKPSGWKVCWYKYIGRDMKVIEGNMPWNEVLQDCVNDALKPIELDDTEQQ